MQAMQLTRILFFVSTILIVTVTNAQQNNAGAQERAYLVRTMLTIADPVLNALSKNQLKRQMPVEAKTGDRSNYTYLEAFGRFLSGMAPWLELGPDNSNEGKLRAKYIQLAR